MNIKINNLDDLIKYNIKALNVMLSEPMTNRQKLKMIDNVSSSLLGGKNLIK